MVRQRNARRSLIFAIILLAQAQIIATLGTITNVSWLLYHPTLLAGLIMGILAILNSFQGARSMQTSRYFAVLGSILIVALTIISVEFGFNVLSSGSTISRTLLMPLMMGQAFLSFSLLYIIVIYLGRINDERTAELRREQQLRSELTQLIVHDLKSPLTVIRSGMNLLSKENLGTLSDTQKRLLANLEMSSNNILHMINDLLDVERFESGVFKLQKRQVNLQRLLQERTDELQIVAGTRRQRLTLYITNPIPSFRADKMILQRVVENVLANALKFTPDEGVIDVHARADGGEVEITVSDNGPGVPPAQREQIFEKFGQVAGGERQGAGLGLAFCRMAVEAHNGRIRVTDSPHGGAMFVVTLPLDSSDQGRRQDENKQHNQLTIAQSSQR